MMTQPGVIVSSYGLPVVLSLPESHLVDVLPSLTFLELPLGSLCAVVGLFSATLIRPLVSIWIITPYRFQYAVFMESADASSAA